ncbi:MAG: hypothetical protein M3Z05_19600 [Gemmatimonadota bacterium]|nr:hypothetical protein [Gemmatimonadota bacterium]
MFCPLNEPAQRNDMECKFILIADTANISREGKLNIAGDFNAIFAQTEPIGWPIFSVVVRLEGSLSEGEDHAVQLKVSDDDGMSVFESAPFPIKFGKAGRGMPTRADLVLPIAGLVFPRFGDHSVSIFVDGILRATTVLYVKSVQDRPGG